jgi:hypothetical protein
MASVRVEAHVDAVKSTEAFKQARRDVNARLRDGLRAAGEKVALPEARRLAPSKTGELASSLAVKSTARSASLTTSLRGKKGRRVGLLEFGGTVKTQILPRKAKALYFGGRFAARVTAPRTIRGRHFLTRAVHEQLPEIERRSARRSCARSTASGRANRCSPRSTTSSRRSAKRSTRSSSIRSPKCSSTSRWR